jgi:hypothetical protein
VLAGNQELVDREVRILFDRDMRLLEQLLDVDVRVRIDVAIPVPVTQLEAPGLQRERVQAEPRRIVLDGDVTEPLAIAGLAKAIRPTPAASAATWGLYFKTLLL